MPIMLTWPPIFILIYIFEMFREVAEAIIAETLHISLPNPWNAQG